MTAASFPDGVVFHHSVAPADYLAGPGGGVHAVSSTAQIVPLITGAVNFADVRLEVYHDLYEGFHVGYLLERIYQK